VKALSILQMIFGVLAVFVSWSLGITKACIVVQEVGKTGSPPPNYIFELVLLFLGLAILTCGY
jgi:short subunit fatty acids transporter